MLDVAPSELLLVAIVALVVIGPKDLPKALRVLGYWIGRVRGVARQFRSGFDSMVREAELAEMEKKWADENDRIMREHRDEHGDEPSAERGADLGDEHRIDSIASDHAAPVMVEQPVVEPATPAAPAPRPDGAMS